jgi:hypothetical protein
VGAGAQTDAAELELEPAAIDVLDAAAAAPAPPPQGGGRPHAAATVVAGRETEPEVALEPRRPARPRAAAALAAAVLLALGLAAQLVHHFRERLAETSLVGPAVAALYARLGLPLEPRWDLTAYDVRQWGAQSEETAGVLQLRASIVNRATRAQPYPLLRVTLEDRFGAQVGRREFTPTEYLPGHTAPRALLAPGARADADLKLADPGNQAVGFELDVCLMRHGRLFCGADAKAGGG